MGGVSPDREWGAWMLGDMSDVLRRACDVVGRTSEIEWVQVSPPTSAEALPRVAVVVPTEGAVFRLRRSLDSGEYAVRFLGGATDRSWRAEVLGLRLLVMAREGEGR